MRGFVRRPAVAFVLGAALAVAVFAGKAAFGASAGGTIHACYKPSNGFVYVVGVSSRMSCQPGDVALDWNMQGPPGADGTSIVNTQLAVGDANCPDGGTAFTGAGGTTYACNGAPGAAGKDGTDGIDGKNGTDGKDGQSVTSRPLGVGDPNCPAGGTEFTSASGLSYACNGADGAQGPPGTFTGQFTSSNGANSIAVTDGGIVLTGPLGSIHLDGGGIKIDSALNLLLQGAGTTDIKGSVVSVNGSQPIARVGDQVQVNVVGPYCGCTGTGTIISGSPTVTAG